MTTLQTLEMALEALENNRQTHHYCEDTWYSCPKHEDGCANDFEGDECNCGADKANAEIDAAITALRQAIANETLNKKAENARELGLDYEPAAQRWAVFCSECKLKWSVTYPHSGKSICSDCKGMSRNLLQPSDEITKLRGEIGVLVGLLKWALQVIETVEGEDVAECEALMELQNKITYAIQGASI